MRLVGKRDRYLFDIYSVCSVTWYMSVGPCRACPGGHYQIIRGPPFGTLLKSLLWIGVKHATVHYLNLRRLNERWDNPDMRWPACVMIVADALAPIRCQGNSNRHADSTVVFLHVIKIALQPLNILCSRETGNPSVSLLFVGSFSHGDNTICSPGWLAWHWLVTFRSTKDTIMAA